MWKTLSPDGDAGIKVEKVPEEHSRVVFDLVSESDAPVPEVNMAYVAVPSNVIEQEMADEALIPSEVPGGDPDDNVPYQIPTEWKDEAGTIPMKLKDVTSAEGDDREQWKKAMQVELDALQAKGVVVEMTREQLGA